MFGNLKIESNGGSVNKDPIGQSKTISNGVNFSFCSIICGPTQQAAVHPENNQSENLQGLTKDSLFTQAFADHGGTLEEPQFFVENSEKELNLDDSIPSRNDNDGADIDELSSSVQPAFHTIASTDGLEFKQNYNSTQNLSLVSSDSESKQDNRKISGFFGKTNNSILESDFQEDVGSKIGNDLNSEELDVIDFAKRAEIADTRPSSPSSVQVSPQNPIAETTIDSQISQTIMNQGLNNSFNKVESSHVNLSAVQSAGSPTSLDSSLDQSSIIDQVVNRLNSPNLSLNKNGSREINLQIYPQELGSLSITVFQYRDEFTASIIASEWSASEVLSRDKALLLDALRDKGLDFADVSISLKDKNENRTGSSDTSEQNQRQLDQAVFRYQPGNIDENVESAITFLNHRGSDYLINVIA